MIPELYISVVSCFGIKEITKDMAFVLVFYRFRDISSYKSEKGDTGDKLSRTGFIYKQKKSMFVPLNGKRFVLKRNTTSFGLHIEAIITPQFFKLHSYTFIFL